MSWPTAPLVLARPNGQSGNLDLLAVAEGNPSLYTEVHGWRTYHAETDTLTDVVPVTAVPTAALDALRDAGGVEEEVVYYAGRLLEAVDWRQS